jgi:hypothetical protein
LPAFAYGEYIPETVTAGLRLFVEESMRYIEFVLWACLATSQLGDCKAAEPGIDPQMVLQKWEAASRDVHSWSASFTRLEYDTIFTKQPPTCRGRLYWNDTGREFYEVDGNFLTARGDGGVLSVDYRARTYVQTPKAEIERIRQRFRNQGELSWCERFSRDLARAVLGDVAIEDVLMICTDVHAAAIQRRFECSCRENGEAIFVTALPNTQVDRRDFQQIDVQLSRDTFQLLAHRRITHDGTTIVHVFEDVRQNATPADLDEQLHPRLKGFRKIEFPCASEPDPR